MKREAFNHPKMLDLASRLKISRTHACGVVSNLWNWAADAAPQGNVGKWPDGAIAVACDWPGDPSVFIDALVAAGWLDRCAVHRLVIHDLAEHAPEWLKTKLKRTKRDFVLATPIQNSQVPSANTRTTADEHSAPRGAIALLCSALQTSALQTSFPQGPPTPEAPKDDPPKPEPRRRQRRNNPPYVIGALPIPEALSGADFAAAWERWVMYRHQRGKSITTIAAKEQLDTLARAGPVSAIEAISKAIRNDHTGLYPEERHGNRHRPDKNASPGQRFDPAGGLGAV